MIINSRTQLAARSQAAAVAAETREENKKKKKKEKKYYSRTRRGNSADVPRIPDPIIIIIIRHRLGTYCHKETNGRKEEGGGERKSMERERESSGEGERGKSERAAREI